MHRDVSPTTYLLASRRNGTLYVGVTSNLIARIYQHREGAIAGFSREHSIKRLVWFEQHRSMGQAIIREKQITNWTRRDATITRFLTSQGAGGVPLYLWYPKGGGEPKQLPQVLTPDLLTGLAKG